jgi:hypothetical protein
MNERYFPIFGMGFMYLHSVGTHVECDIRIFYEIVSKIFFDYISFIATADNKFIYTVVRINFHDMPENGFATNFDHRFWTDPAFLAYAGPKATC